MPKLYLAILKRISNYVYHYLTLNVRIRTKNNIPPINFTEECIWSVSFQREPEIGLGMPEVRFEWSNLIVSDFLYGYDITPGGEKFKILEGCKPRTITVVLNWIEEPKHKIQE